jgi:hypothetical protein
MPVVDRSLKKATDARYWARQSPEKRAARAARRRLLRAPRVQARADARLLARQQRDIEAQAALRLGCAVRAAQVAAPLPSADPLMALFGRGVIEALS